MSCYRILPFLIVVISFADCLPPGNVTHTPRRVFKFPQNTSTAVRTPSGAWARDKNTTSRLGPAEEIFVFPDDDVNDTPPAPPPPPPVVVNRAKFKIDVKNQALACADGTTYCERVDGYPRNILENIFDNELDQFKELQGTDELRSPPITQRIDANTTNEQPLCLFIEEVVYPEAAKNKDDKWLFVVNTRSFKQGVRIEKCVRTSEDKEQSCFFNDSFPIGYKTVCKQKYIYRTMVAIDEDGKPVKDIFALPSCCSCSVIAVGTSFRQGVLRKAIRTTTTPPPKN